MEDAADRIRKIASSSLKDVQNIDIPTDVEDFQEWAMSLIEDRLEAIDAALDEQEKTPQKNVTAAIPKYKSSSKSPGPVPFHRSTLKVKPQLSFELPMDNANAPVPPPLDSLKGIIDVDIARVEQQAAIQNSLPFSHPLQDQLEALTYSPTQLDAPTEPNQPGSFEEVPFTYVDTLELLLSVQTRLSASKELAVDLEAHSYRSFQGFCCLMQLSTRSEDIIIDVLSLRKYIGPVLAPIFADSTIVKVLHGADSDIVWLQRDFGLFVVNMFDTGQAARVLNYPAHGLGYLLQKHVQFDSDKRYQLADWRIRPLSQDMIHYARADTHFLLYIYDVLKKELAELSVVPRELGIGTLNPLEIVLERSRRICLSLYQREQISEDSFLGLYDKIPEASSFGSEQTAMFAALYSWRDKIAREEDESTGYVMSRAVLVKLVLGKPSSAGEVIRLAGKSAPVVARRAEEVAHVVRAAYADIDRIAEIKKGSRKKERPSNHQPIGHIVPREDSMVLQPKAVKPLVTGKALQIKKSAFVASIVAKTTMQSQCTELNNIHSSLFLPFEKKVSPEAFSFKETVPPDMENTEARMEVVPSVDQRAMVRAAKALDVPPLHVGEELNEGTRENEGENENENEGENENENEDEDENDFLPMPLSEKYGMKRTGKRAPPAQGVETEVKRHLIGLGLESDDEADNKRQKVDYSMAGEKFDIGMISPSAAGRGDRRGRGRRGGRGRGRGSGNRGGRRSKDEERSRHRPGKFNPYAAPEVNNIKAGKRNQAGVRSGNKSASFGRR